MNDLYQLKNKALKEVEEITDLVQLENFRIKYLGKKGEITQALRSLKNSPLEEKKKVGPLLNELKDLLEKVIQEKRKALLLAEEDKILDVDLTLPGRHPLRGSLHPLTLIIEEICNFFSKLGFEIITGPEIELDYYNFTALNIPEWHPARDMQATFYLKSGSLLRTHTSPMQIRAMLKKEPPLRIIAPGKVYRCDADVRHSPMFHQIEGLMIDEKVSFSDLKGVLSLLAKEIFGENINLRFRPSYFPFTEPSLEMDISCIICKGKGCRVCSQTGWLEILGAGMVHPEVLKTVNYDISKWQGFAFGLGVERIAMIKFGIDDIRLFFDNHLYFLEFFK